MNSPREISMRNLAYLLPNLNGRFPDLRRSQKCAGAPPQVDQSYACALGNDVGYSIPIPSKYQLYPSGQYGDILEYKL